MLLTEAVYEAAWRYAYRLASTREDAEDLLQDALVHAWRRVAQLREPSAFRAWLFSIIRTKHLEKVRKRRVQTSPLEDVRAHTPERAAVPAPDGFAEAFCRLPEPHRELLSLFYIEGLSLKETGQVLGVKTQAVKLRLFRARAALRKLLSLCGAESVARIEGVDSL